MSTDTTLYQNNMQILPQTHLWEVSWWVDAKPQHPSTIYPTSPDRFVPSVIPGNNRGPSTISPRQNTKRDGPKIQKHCQGDISLQWELRRFKNYELILCCTWLWGDIKSELLMSAN
jgi:hypothetical protein